MKKYLIVVLLLALSLSFFSCGSNDEKKPPVSGGDEETEDARIITEPAFVGWGGSGAAGNNFTFNFTDAASYSCRITYNFPADLSASYTKITMDYTVAKLESGDKTKPMKLVIQDAIVDEWEEKVDVKYSDHSTDGVFSYKEALEKFPNKCITIAHNNYRNPSTNPSPSADYTITINKITFSKE
jgi:hypothetical protein